MSIKWIPTLQNLSSLGSSEAVQIRYIMIDSITVDTFKAVMRARFHQVDLRTKLAPDHKALKADKKLNAFVSWH